ncbi:two-component regulator propeller domain-containing protein [Chitinophagaceae bacterium LWZ2-11]
MFFLSFFQVSAQEPGSLKFKKISIEQGLSNSTIECIFQDSKGFIWFGTRDGLNRFDGREMKVYRNNPTDTSSISDSYIKCIFEAKDRSLWVGTMAGLNKLNADKGSFTHYKQPLVNPANSGKSIINCIKEDEAGNLLIGTGGSGLGLFNTHTNVFTFLHHQTSQPNSLCDDRVNYLLKDKKGTWWVATENGLDAFDKNTQSFTHYINNAAGNPAANVIKIIQESPGGDLWLGTEDNGLALFNADKNTFTSYKHQYNNPGSPLDDMIKSLLVDKAGNVWVGSITGLNLLKPNSNVFIHYQNEPGNPNSLSQRTVSALFEDNRGNLWAGTHRGGVNLYAPGVDKFNLYRQETFPGSLSYSDVKSFCEDSQGRLWVGTDGGGLNLFSRSTRTFKQYRYSPFHDNTIGADAVLDVMEDSKHRLWVATWGGGLNLMNTATGTFKRFMNIAGTDNSISSNFVQKTFEDKEGNLWVATYYGGLNLLNADNQSFSKFTQTKSGTSKLSGANIVSLNEDRHGNLWIGTDDGGLNCYNRTTDVIEHYFNKEEKVPDIRVIFFDKKGQLWVGQKGLYLFDEAKKTFNPVQDKAGLSTTFIKGITEDEQGNLWISTSNGLTNFNPVTLAFKNYNTADGLQGLEFETNAFLRAKDGEMFFGGVNGFNSFFPKDIQLNSYVPPVYLTDFQIFNKNMNVGQTGSPLTTDVNATEAIKLSYDQSSLSFNFAVLNYTGAENNQYAYKLENFDKDWNYAGTGNKASYTNLSPGKYIFKVKGANNDGVWNEKGTSVVIIITPPFWQTTWFMLLAALLIIGCTYLALRFKRSLELRALEEKKREEIHSVQLEFFTNISHEFRTPLTLILGPLEKLMKEDARPFVQHSYQTMHRNASRLLSLINELMDFRKLEAGALRLKVSKGNIGSFLTEIADEFEEWSQEKKIEFKLVIPPALSATRFDRQVLEKIMLNLINNAFKYTQEGGTIEVDVLQSLHNFKPAFENELLFKNDYRAKEYIYIRVADSGIGISKESILHLFERYYRITESHLGSGVGLAFVKNLVFLHKGDIYVYSEKHKGTEIIIALPAGENDYNPEEKQSHHEGEVKLESIIYRQEPIVTAYNPMPDDAIGTQDAQQHILIVEDNIELRNYLKENLSPLYQISEASDGGEGFEKTLDVFPDLIISDVMMPIVNGIDFCRQVKQDIATSHIPFIMLTAKDALEAKLEGVGSGADFYFAKPFSMELLLLTIRNVFEQRKKLKERYSKDYHIEAKELVHSEKDKIFIENLLTVIESQLVNPELDVDFVCSEIGMSKTKLYQKLKSISGQSIGEFIRTIRLRKAAEIMTKEDVPLSDVMYRIGIQTQSYFTKAFKKEFGKTPSQFLQELKK